MPSSDLGILVEELFRYPARPARGKEGGGFGNGLCGVKFAGSLSPSDCDRQKRPAGLSVHRLEVPPKLHRLRNRWGAR